MQARYRADYPGEFVVLESRWSAGKKEQVREWIQNPIENQHISGRAACIGGIHERDRFDYTRLQRHRGGLLGSKKLQTYGIGSVATEMRCDFIVETNNDKLNKIIETKYQESNIVYTTARMCILHPGEFVLASTYEVITLPDDIAGRLEGKSSLGRLGLLTHSTAGFIDPGFSGHITLELSNVANLPVKLYPGMKIGQLCLIKLSSSAEHPYGSAIYGSRYQGQRGPTPSKSWLNFHKTKIQ